MSGFDDYYNRWKEQNKIEEKSTVPQKRESVSRGVSKSLPKATKKSRTTISNINNTESQTVQKPTIKISQNVMLPTTSNVNIPNYRIKSTTPAQVKLATAEERKNIAENGQNNAKEVVEAMIEAEKRDKEIEKGGIDKANAIISNILESFQGGVQTGASGIAQAVMLPTANVLKGIGNDIRAITQNDDENYADKALEKILDSAEDLSLRANRQNRINANIENTGVRTLGNISSTIGNMLPAIVSNTVLPGSGLAVTGLSAGGNAAQETLNKDRTNLDKAILSGAAKGAIEAATEKITGGNLIGKGSLDDVVKRFIGDRIKGKVGQKIASKAYEFVGENLEEFLSDNLGNVIDKLVNNKDLPSFQEWLSQTGETAKDTFLTTLALNMMGLGGNTYNEVQEYVKDKQAQTYLNEAEKIIKQENLTEKLKNDVVDTAIQRAEGTENNQSNQPVLPTQQTATNNQETNYKQQQFDIINKSNPMSDDYHVGIRDVNDIKSFAETINDDESFVWGDFSKEDAEKALKEGKVTVYSSHPIEQGGFVTTSQNMARDYAGNGQIYSQEVNLDDVAWINGDEGQYAKVNNNNALKLEQRVSGDTLLNAQDLIEELKDVGAEIDENGYVTVYHQTTKENADNIRKAGTMFGNEDGIFFSTSKEATQAEGRGNEKIELKIPVEELVLDDIFENNADVKIPLKTKNDILDVSKYLVKNVTDATLGDLKLPLQQQTTEQTTSVLPTNKTMNPTEISQLTKADATTTPKLPTREYRRGNKQSNFAANILGDAQFIDENIRQELAKDENVRYYQGITNEQTLEKAYKSLQDGGATETMKWYNKKDNITPEDVAKGWILLKQYQDAGDIQSMVEVAKKMRTMGTQAGQTVQAYNILSRLTPEGMFYYSQSELSEAFDKFSKGKTQKWIDEHRSEFELTPEETQFIKDKMETVQNTNDERTKKVALAEIQSMLQNKIPPTAGQSVKAWMRISMLFNPKTQVRNVMGNAVILPVNATSDVISGAIDKAIARKTGVRTTGVTKEGLKGYAQGFKRGLFESYEDFRKGINTRNIEGNRFEIGEGKSFKDKGIGKVLNAVDNILSFSLDAGDRGFYEATFTNSINNQMVLNNTTEVTPEMIEIATNEALQRTWQDNNEYTKAVLGIRNILNKVNVKGYGLGDVLIPFAKTPANLTKAIVDYSPVGLAKTLAVDARRFNNSLQNGQYSAQAQHDFVQNMGKGIAGTFLYVLGSALAKAGVISGEADDDKDLKNFMKNTLGINSYSIKIGDKTFTYDWAQPVATPFAIMSNYEKYSKDNPDANALEKGIKALNIGSEQLLEQSFMESINTVLNGNGTTLENLSKAVLDLPARAIPTFSKQIADLVDSKQRTSFEYDKPLQSAINSLKSKLPFVSRTLPESKDTLGNTIEKYGGENNIFNVMLNPANVNKSTLNKAGKEIYDVYMSTGDTTIFPRVAPYYINSKGEKTTLTSEQRSKFQEISGKYVENAMNGLLNNKDYNKMKNEDKAKLINEIVTDSYAKAKYDVLGMDTDSYKKIRETLKDVSTTTYYDYKTKTNGLKKDKEKLEVLADANYKDKEKEKIYREYFNKDDDLFDIAKKSKIDTSQYLKYKANVENTKASAEDYLKKANISNEQKLLLLGTKYALSNQEKSALAKYINNLNITKSEKLDIYQQLKGFKIHGDKVSW